MTEIVKQLSFTPFLWARIYSQCDSFVYKHFFHFNGSNDTVIFMTKLDKSKNGSKLLHYFFRMLIKAASNANMS